MTENKIVKIENKWQKIWKENKVFEPKINEKQEKYFGNVAYPYANSVLHIGHGRTYTLADIYLRYQRILGKNVLQPLGFHISGTPVLAVADGIKRGDEKILKQVKDAISDYIINEEEQNKLIETFKDPKNIASFFSSTIEGALDSIGIGIDWTRQFTTGEKIYNKFIEWQYSKLKEKNLLVQGKYPILFSPLDENAVGEDDIKDGDTDKVSISNMVAIKFQIKNSNDFILCSTLRPDAIFGATNLWIKPDMKIVKLKVNGENLIVAKDAIKKMKYQFDNVEIIEEFLGKDLLNKTVITPLTKKEIPIYPAQFCDPKHGTGLVYSSPADSPHDYINLFETKFPGKSLSEFKDEEPLKLTPITKTFDKKGNEIKYKFNIPAYDILIKKEIFNELGNENKLENAKQELYKEAHFGAKMINSGQFNNLPLKNNIGGDKVRDYLFEKKLALPFFETSRRAKTRSNDDVIVANLNGQWFLKYSDRKVKDQAQKLLKKAEFFPSNLRATQEGYIEWANMRPCARKRGLGTQIPYDRDWIVEPLSDSTIYQMLYLISDLIREYKIKPEELTPEIFDYIYFEKGDISKFKINKEFLNRSRESVKYWNNVDFRYVGQTHMSNHLNFLIYHYSLIFPESMWPTKIITGGLMMRDGEKISKSKGNGTPLYRVKEIYGADLYRLYIGTNSNFDVEMDFKEEEILALNKKFNKWIELIENSFKFGKLKFEEYSEIDKWLISKFYKSVKIYFENFENFKIREAFVEILYEVLNNISYHTRRTSQEETNKVLRFIAEDYLILMTPITPHITEELYSKIKTNNKDFISLKKFETKLEDFIDNEILNKEEIIFDLIKKIHNQLDKTQNKIKKIEIIQAREDKFKLFDKIKESLENKNKNIKEIFQDLNKEFPNYNKFIKKFLPKCLGNGINYYLNKEDELKLLKENKKFLEKEFETKIEIISNDENLNPSPRDFGIKLIF